VKNTYLVEIFVFNFCGQVVRHYVFNVMEKVYLIENPDVWKIRWNSDSYITYEVFDGMYKKINTYDKKCLQCT